MRKTTKGFLDETFFLKRSFCGFESHPPHHMHAQSSVSPLNGETTQIN